MRDGRGARLGAAGATWLGPLLLCTLGAPGASRNVSKQVSLGGSAPQWAYVSKFGYRIGTGTYEVRFRRTEPGPEGTQPVNLDLEVYLDELWGEIQIDHVPECLRNASARKVLAINVPPDGSWSGAVWGQLSQQVRPHVWYFSIRDCQNSLSVATKIEVSARLLQDTDLYSSPEFSVEMAGTPTIAALELFVGAMFGAWFCHACINFRRSAGQVHSIILVLAFACFSQYLSYLLHCVHLVVYASDGVGWHTVDVLSEVSSVASQIIVTALSIFLAHGHTILPGSRATGKVLVAAFALITGVNIAIVAAGKFRHEDHFKWHENEGSTGLALIAMRLCLFLWFLLALKFSYAGCSPKLHPFIAQLMLASSVFYLTYPLIFLISSLFAPYLRHKVMLTGLFLMQALSLGWYTQMFLTRGQYFEVSSLGGNLLPTPKGSRRTLDASFRMDSPVPARSLSRKSWASSPPCSPNVWEKSD